MHDIFIMQHHTCKLLNMVINTTVHVRSFSYVDIMKCVTWQPKLGLLRIMNCYILYTLKKAFCHFN